MEDPNRIVAAILAAGMCSRLDQADEDAYLAAYRRFRARLSAADAAPADAANLEWEAVRASYTTPKRS